ncbi:MAG: dockerin type I repeat-containing protein [Acutalibacteraceae bacterium]|jgi:hypothetical protein
MKLTKRLLALALSVLFVLPMTVIAASAEGKVVGTWTANNEAATMKGQNVIQMDWTYADSYPIDLSGSDLTKVYICFDLTLTHAEVFTTGNLVLRSAQTEGENNLQYSVASRLPTLVEGKNEIRVPVLEFTGKTGTIDWATIERLRLYFDGIAAKAEAAEVPLEEVAMTMENIRLEDETEEDYQPVEGAVAEWHDSTVHTQNGATLVADWLTLVSPVDLSGRDLSKVFLTVDYTLTNDSELADDEVFGTGFFRLRSPDDEGTTPPDGENNVGYAFRSLQDKGIMEQPVAGKNSVKVPLSEINAYTGEIDWANVNRFRMYFDGIPEEVTGTTLKLDSVAIIDENEELAEGVLGAFSSEETYESDKTLETPWITSYVKPVTDPDNTYLHVNFTLTGEGPFETGFFRLRSADTTPTEDNEQGENNVGYNIKSLTDAGVIAEPAEGENDVMIPLSEYSDPKGEIDWSAINRFRMYFNNQEGLNTTLKLNTVEILDKSADVDPTLVADFTPVVAGDYDTAENATLQAGWVDLKKPAQVDVENATLKLALTLSNDTGEEDSAVFASGKILLASALVDGEEQSVSVTIKPTTGLKSGENELEIPLTEFVEEKGAIDWDNVSRFRIFIDSTNKFDNGTTAMIITNAQIVDPSKADDQPSDVTIGDVDGKDGITAADALMALQIATGKINATEAQTKAADVNGNGEVDASDALAILQFATGKINQF